MKKKRMTAIMLLAVLFILSACNGKVENPEEMVDHDVLVWRMAFPAAEGQADSLLVLWENGLNQILKEKGADYTVSIEPFSTDDAENRKAVRVADELKKLKDEKEQTDLITLRSATQYPDLAGCHLVYPACAEEGLLLPLDSLLASEKGSSLKEAIPEKDLERAKLNGTTYGLSALHPTIDATAYSIEQMEELGITKEELQGSIFEKEDLLRRVKEETGKIPYYANAYRIRYKLGLWVVSPSENLVMNQEGRFVNVTETKEFKEYLTRFVEWKEKGLIGCIQEWSADSVEDIPFANSIASYRIAPYEAEVEIGLSGGITEKVLMYVVPDETCPNVNPYWADDKTCIASWSKNQEKAEDFLILLMTDPDVANLMQYGREGKEYTMSGTTLEELPVT